MSWSLFVDLKKEAFSRYFSPQKRHRKQKPPVQRVVCTRAISPCYRPAPKDAGFHFVQAILSLPPLLTPQGVFVLPTPLKRVLIFSYT